MSQEQSETQAIENENGNVKVQAQPEAEVEPQAEEVLTNAQEISEGSPKKRVKKKKLTEADVRPPKPSIWPLSLALAIVVMLVGLAYGALFLGIGALLVVICIVGWALERRN